jgi:oxidase EvaA
MNMSYLFAQSWTTSEGIVSNAEVLSWVEELNQTVHVDIQKTSLSKTGWFYDRASGQIVNKKRSFFQISGIKWNDIEQPIIIQDEIGYLGFICKEIHGVLHFLTQAKIEPGNVNRIQLSPTIQATKSNFSQAHGGERPLYLNWFINSINSTIIVDQIQSEQSSRFFKKRNRNIIILLNKDDDIEENERFKWLTLGQLKKLMRIDNLVNMDSRTVLSCIPFYKCNYKINATVDPFLEASINEVQSDILPLIFNFFNEAKMFVKSKPILIPLYQCEHWNYNEDEFICKRSYPFKVTFCDIAIDGREVNRWGQPLFEAAGMAIFGLFTKVDKGIRYFLVHTKSEIGCFDTIELSPTIQLESIEMPNNIIEKYFFNRYSKGIGVKYDVILSEEGGRFYHEQNRNIIIEIDCDEITEHEPGYFWLTYNTLNLLTQINNILNIQLRNLLSLLEM